uniref:Insulin-like growth factor-binding protein 5 n=1 Tax=Callorhinchus milii TaxID=7868 RepID=V9LA97_CALMI
MSAVRVLLALCCCCCRPPRAAGQVIECAPCDAAALLSCPPPRRCQLVREARCGCCLTCALAEGEPCGVYSARCAAALRCVPRAGESAPLQALLQGRGVCWRGAQRGGKANDGILVSKESDIPYDIMQKFGQREGHHPKGTVHSAINPSKPTSITTQLPVSEYGPCRREMQAILEDLKPQYPHSPGDLYIPNCDTRGFYRRKQCRPSRGRKRGQCWCVDRYGLPVPGTESRGRGGHCTPSASFEQSGDVRS